MKPYTTRWLQRIQEGLPLSLHVEHELAWVEDGMGRKTHFPVCPAGGLPMREILDATLEVAQGGRFLTAEEIQTRPLTAWLTNKESAVRLVLNRDAEGKPFPTVPFQLVGIETVARPTLSPRVNERDWKMACLLPCQEVRIYTSAPDKAWRVFHPLQDTGGVLPPKTGVLQEAHFHDRFNEIAAALPVRPCARPYGNPCVEGMKKEAWEGFRMGGEYSRHQLERRECNGA